MVRRRPILALALTLVLCVSALHPGALAAFSTLWRAAAASGPGMGPPAPRVSLDSQSLVEVRADRGKQAPAFQFSPTLTARVAHPVPPVWTGHYLGDRDSRRPQEGLSSVRLARAPPRFHS